MYSFKFDERTGILHVVVNGFWTIDTARRYKTELQDQVDNARSRAGGLLLLVDCTQAAAQSSEVMAMFDEIDRSVIQSSDDRMAVVVTSSLQKIQVQRLYSTEQTKAFLSPSSAMTWMRAYFDPMLAHQPA